MGSLLCFLPETTGLPRWPLIVDDDESTAGSDTTLWDSTAQRHAAGALNELEDRWGTRADALERLDHLGRAIGRLQHEQDVLRAERDELVAQLRQVGESWNSLAARTGLSRQALSQRITDSNRRV